MKKLLLLTLLLASGCLWAIADPAPSVQSKADSVKAVMAARVKDSIAAILIKAKSDSSAVAAAKGSETKLVTDTLAKAKQNPDMKTQQYHYATLGWILIIGILLFFLIIAFRSNLLRDKVTNESAFLAEAQKFPKYKNVTNPNDIPRTYSLSRSQLGIWTMVISCSYIYVELCSNCGIKPIEIGQSLLMLMGISAGTAAVGSVIDSSNSQDPHHQDGPSQGFFLDVLSDQNGISIHRFQNFIWTIIAVVIYLCQLKGLQCGYLPTLDSTLISLTGISSLTYLGLKVNENKPPVPPVVPPVPPVPPVVPPVPPIPPVVPPVPPVPPVVPPVPPAPPAGI